MTAKYWTKTGADIWSVAERRVFDFKNLETDEVVSCDCVADVMSHGLVPVIMPKVKNQKTSKKLKVEKSSRRGPRAKSNYKGVSPAKTPGKFRAHFWDKGKNKNIYIGTYDSELLAAAAYAEHIGNYEKAKRLLNEYQEGDPPAE